MKKRMIGRWILIASAVAVLGLLTACGDEGEGSLDKIDPAKYVTLGEYKGLKIAGTDTTVSDEDVERSIQSALAEYSETKEVTGRAAKMGDIVNIDYEGKRDGVAFDGGTGNKDLELGSGTFIPGFEEGVVGMKPGDEKDLPLTFPEDYHNEELAGANVVFHVKANSISEKVFPELTDEFVQGLGTGAQTVEEYKSSIRDQLTEQNEAQARSDAESELMQTAVDNAACDTDKLPAWLLEKNENEYRTSTESYVSQYGMTLDDYITQIGSTHEEFDAEAKEYAVDKAKNDLVVKAIANAEGLEVTDQELEDYYAEYAAQYNTTAEQLKSSVPEDELKTYLLQMKVIDLLYNNAVIGSVAD